MEFTWLKTCAARKYTFFRAHFWSPGTAYLKCTCPHVYFWCFDVVYFLHMFGAFAMRFLLKSVFLRVWHLCLAQAYFFYALNLGTCVLCRCIYFTRVWKSDLYVYCGCISYPRIVHFFWNAHFWTAPVEAKITVLSCKCILATKNKFSWFLATKTKFSWNIFFTANYMFS